MRRHERLADNLLQLAIILIFALVLSLDSWSC